MFNLLNGAKSTDKTSAIDKAVDAFMKVNGDISEQVKKIAIPQGLVIGKAIDENKATTTIKVELSFLNILANIIPPSFLLC